MTLWGGATKIYLIGHFHYKTSMGEVLAYLSYFFSTSSTPPKTSPNLWGEHGESVPHDHQIRLTSHLLDIFGLRLWLCLKIWYPKPIFSLASSSSPWKIAITWGMPHFRTKPVSDSWLYIPLCPHSHPIFSPFIDVKSAFSDKYPFFIASNPRCFFVKPPYWLMLQSTSTF